MQTIDRFDGDYSFLSNFHISKVKFMGVWFSTVEHAYVAAKCPTMEHILKISKLDYREAGKAKKIGQKVKIRSDWENVKVDIMKDLLEQKFQDPMFKEKLLATGDSILIEGNYWHDNFWGNCHCQKCGSKPKLNMLGTLLMKLRDDLLKS